MQTLEFNNGVFAVKSVADDCEATLEAFEVGGANCGDALVLPNDASLDALRAAAESFNTIILEFPAFKDGRAYSQARLLRERFGFKGEIRARGDVLRDQIFFMIRCGFNAFEFAGDLKAADAAVEEFSAVYQAASDEREPAWRLRHRRAAAAAAA